MPDEPAVSAPPAAPRRKGRIFGRIGRGKDFNFRRFEFSCLIVAEFGCLLLALPVYLFFGRIGVWHVGPPPGNSLSEGGWGETLRFAALVGGALGMLFIPTMSKIARGRWLWMFAVAMLLLALLMAGEWQGPLLAIVGYASLAWVSLVTLDAVTGVRPAAEDAAKFIKLQAGAAVLVMFFWFMPMVLANHASVLQGWIGPNWRGLAYPMARLGPVAAEMAGLAAILGAFGNYRTWLNMLGRLLGTLALTCAMAVSLVMLLRAANLPHGPAHWEGLEYLWIFLLLSGVMLIFWAGVTQRLLTNAREIMENGPDAIG